MKFYRILRRNRRMTSMDLPVWITWVVPDSMLQHFPALKIFSEEIFPIFLNPFSVAVWAAAGVEDAEAVLPEGVTLGMTLKWISRMRSMETKSMWSSIRIQPVMSAMVRVLPPVLKREPVQHVVVPDRSAGTRGFFR